MVIAISAALFHICIGLYFLLLILLDYKFSVPWKKKYKENEEKRKKKITKFGYILSQFMSLESQKIFVRRFCPLSPPPPPHPVTSHWKWEGAYIAPQTPSAEPATLAFTDPQIIFLYYPLIADFLVLPIGQIFIF